ncbi:MAG: lipoprotein signal peptidase [Bacteroidaceae bacterium]|nr:lipoprotein signal peptidase [Bacteroidaceae bacterium]
MVLESRKRSWIVLSLLTLAIVADQVIKIAVKTSMQLGEGIMVFGEWFQIRFIENNGMAFGMELFGKLFLTSFRMVAVCFLIYYLVTLLRSAQKPFGYVICIAMVLAGALGNLVDCLFYGEIFSSSLGQVATFVPWGEGYASFMQGRVVDMFYFPLFTWPDWLPLVGGDIFFAPVFNFADACISCSVFALLIFYRDIIFKVEE